MGKYPNVVSSGICFPFVNPRVLMGGWKIHLEQHDGSGMDTIFLWLIYTPLLWHLVEQYRASWSHR